MAQSNFFTFVSILGSNDNSEFQVFGQKEGMKEIERNAVQTFLKLNERLTCSFLHWSIYCYPHIKKKFTFQPNCDISL